MRKIRFITFGATSAGGSFGPGDIMRCPDDLAAHLVNDAKCAVYVDAAQPEQAEEKVVKRGRKPKE